MVHVCLYKKKGNNMKQNIYLFSDSVIKRKDNTLVLERICKEQTDDDFEEDKLLNFEYLLGEDLLIPAGDKKYIPVESVESILSFGSIHFNSRFLYFLSQNQIPVHIFSYYGNYSGSFLPAERNTSGQSLIKQVIHYNHPLKRLEIAKQIIEASIANETANLNYYKNRNAQVKDFIEQLEEISLYVRTAQSVDELMGYEGTAKKIYYSSWKNIFKFPVDFSSRMKNPPNNLINALISYGNMVVYSTCLNEIYHTRLYPEVGFVHQAGEGKLSLSYDIADIFKPLLTDRAIFKMINKNIISEKDAFIKNGRCILKKIARQAFIEEMNNKLMTKIQLDGKEVRYSYRRIIREECYKILKHINEEEKYKAYITKW